MTCSFGDFRLDFPVSGIAVRPYEIRIDRAVSKYDYADVKVSVPAGRLIAGSLSDVQPVIVSMNGEQLAYMVIEPDGIQETSLNARLQLRDARTVLERGTVSGDYDDITLQEVLSDVIYPAIEDAHDVITDIIIADKQLAETRSIAYPTPAGKMLNGISDWLSSGNQALPDWYYRLYSWTGGNEIENQRVEQSQRDLADTIGSVLGSVTQSALDLGGRYGGFRFDEVTPATALRMVEDEFEIQSWVQDGTLFVGFPEAATNYGTVGRNPGELYLSEWNVIDTATTVSHVVAEGPYYQLQPRFADNRPAFESDGTLNGVPNNFRGRAVASLAEGLPDSGKVLMLESKRVSGIDQLEERAEARLRREAFNSSSGSFVINSSASTVDDGLEPAEIKIGDTFAVVPQLIRCGDDIPGGIFACTGVTHKISADNGWKTEISVGRILREDDVTVKSYLTNPELDEWVSSDAWYGTETPTSRDGI